MIENILLIVLFVIIGVPILIGTLAMLAVVTVGGILILRDIVTTIFS